MSGVAVLCFAPADRGRVLSFRPLLFKYNDFFNKQNLNIRDAKTKITK
ncbi:hypothetical protein FHS82_002075 [Pseudochelatococcus lubricantis]|uniref:Uncharacterized protein n=1 Tax=Pseudochelatococcus lubricantis TaxID=1538102 RepID=A0ABX0UZ49_9HYPH|nr:hypothetical protein [Pseudochelatococcus lubricantis]